jgi:hypothetical protein
VIDARARRAHELEVEAEQESRDEEPGKYAEVEPHAPVLGQTQDERAHDRAGDVADTAQHGGGERLETVEEARC